MLGVKPHKVLHKERMLAFLQEVCRYKHSIGIDQMGKTPFICWNFNIGLFLFKEVR
jgi:hypothetical protein